MSLTKATYALINGNILNASDFGAGSAKTNAENKAIIDALIDSCTGDNYSKTIIVPNDCEYGYDFDDATTYLTKTNDDASCFVYDYTNGVQTASPSGYPAWGSQIRQWMFARGDASSSGIGNTAGNSTVIHGLWNPGLVMQVNGENIDNRRVKVFFGSRGTNYWAVGQGNQTIAYSLGEPSSNEERRRHFHVAGKTNGVTDYQTKWVIRQDTGHQGWNIAEPDHTYHFVSNGNTVGTLSFVIENTEEETTQVVLKSGSEQVNLVQDNTSGGRLLVKNTSGDVNFQVGADGECFATKGINGGAYTTTERNALTGMSYGTMVFDTTLAKPIWYASPGVWKDATGTSV